MNKPLISIIIPTYNAASFLPRAMDSIVAQTFKNFEVLIIDGLSQDNTTDIAKQYSHKITLKIWSEKDQGIYDAMNKGIKAASGEWIYFLGSDDYFYDHEALMDFSKADKADIDVVYGDVLYNESKKIYDGPFDVVKIYRRNICHQAIFFRQRVFQYIGNYNVSFKGLADWDHNIRWMLSRKISKKYVNRTFAYFETGGYTSLNKDEKFLKRKRLKFILLGFFIAPKNFIFNLIKQELLATLPILHKPHAK